MSIIAPWNSSDPVATSAVPTAEAAFPPWALSCGSIWPRPPSRARASFAYRSSGPGSRSIRPVTPSPHRFLDELHPRGRLLDHERGQADQRTDQQHQHREDQKSRGELGSPAQLCGNSRCSGASTAASTIARSSASARGQTTAPTSSKLPISNTNRKRRAVRPCVIALLLETDRLHVALRLCDGGIHPG